MTVKVTLEKILICLVICVFLASCSYSLPSLGSPVTREEAIEISKNSPLVKWSFENALGPQVEANYYNSSMVEWQKQWINKEIYRRVPEGHGAWAVTWDFGYKERPGGFNVIVVIDAETSVIVHEDFGVIYL